VKHSSSIWMVDRGEVKLLPRSNELYFDHALTSLIPKQYLLPLGAVASLI